MKNLIKVITVVLCMSTVGVVTTNVSADQAKVDLIGLHDGSSDTPGFRVSGRSEAPTAPEVVFPPGPEGLPVFNLLPTFSWSESTDPDSLDVVRYKLEIATDSDFINVTTIDSLTYYMYSITDSLSHGAQYWWRVTAFDNTGMESMSLSTPDFWVWIPGDFDHSRSVDIADLVLMVEYMFLGGPEPTPRWILDIDGVCGSTISDLVHLVDYMFAGGPGLFSKCW